MSTSQNEAKHLTFPGGQLFQDEYPMVLHETLRPLTDLLDYTLCRNNRSAGLTVSPQIVEIEMSGDKL